MPSPFRAGPLLAALVLVPALPAGAVTVSFSLATSLTTPLYTSGTLAVTATAMGGQAGQLYLAARNDLGVVGGSGDFIIDTGETVTFSFIKGKVAQDIVLSPGSKHNRDGDNAFNSYSVEAFVGKQSLGSKAMPLQSTWDFNVSELYGNAPITSLVLRPVGDGLGLRSISYTEATATYQWSGSFSGTWDDGGNWNLASVPLDPVFVKIEPDRGARITGPKAGVMLESLSVGARLSGTAVLALAGGDVATTGDIQVGSRGAIEMSGQVLRAAGLVNAGVVQGSGQIDAVLLNQTPGRVTVSTGVRMNLTGDGVHRNDGSIEVNGGELRTTASLINRPQGIVTAQSATLRFEGGLVNEGALVFTTGRSNLYGDVVNSGQLGLGALGEVVFHRDVTQHGSFVIPSNAAATVLGRYTGAGFTGGGELAVLGVFTPGFSPAVTRFEGDLTLGASTKTTIDVEGLTPGQFDQIQVGGLATLAGSLSVLPAGGFAFAPGQSFVFLVAGGGLSGQFAGLADGALVGRFGEVDLFIDYGAYDVRLYTTPVPEAGTLGAMLAGLGVLGAAVRRRQKGRGA